MGLRLSGPELGKLGEILTRAFSLTRFDQMLSRRLNIEREKYGLGGDYDEIMFRVLNEFNRRYEMAELITAARLSNPDDPELLRFAQSAGIGIVLPEGGNFERLIAKSGSIIPAELLLKRYAQFFNRVCRIEVPLESGERAFGTGFLVGPNAVLTNYHVIEPLRLPAQIAGVVLRFDFRAVTGTVLSRGTEYKLDPAQWLIESSPYSPVDEQINPSTLPDPAHLDYALLKVAGTPAKDPPMPRTAEAGAPARGYEDTTGIDDTLADPSVIIIVQHPRGSGLSIAAGPVLGFNGNRTRIRYQTSTEHGSSGSPCFDADLRLVALHHVGDPDYSIGHAAEFNQGIPIKLIADHIRRNHGAALGSA